MPETINLNIMNTCEKNNSNNLEDLQLIAEVLSGNKQSYGQIIQKYQTKMYNLAYRITHNSEDAMDIVQEGFLKAYYNLNKFDSNKSFMPWIYKITQNTALTHIKKRKSSVDIEKLKNVIGTDSSDDKKLFLESVLNSLPPDYRIILELRHYQDLTYEDIAEELDLSVSAVKSKLFRARKHLQETLRRTQ